jgi:hypothetical protein
MLFLLSGGWADQQARNKINTNNVLLSLFRSLVYALHRIFAVTSLRSEPSGTDISFPKSDVCLAYTYDRTQNEVNHWTMINWRQDHGQFYQDWISDSFRICLRNQGFLSDWRSRIIGLNQCFRLKHRQSWRRICLKVRRNILINCFA